VKVQLSVLAAALALNACSWNDNRWLPREIYQPTSTAWSTQPGSNTVTGQAMFTTLTGETRDCAGMTVRLVPDSGYARQRFMELYGSDVSGVSNGLVFNKYGPDLSDPRYLIASKTTTCDASGKFSFDNVANGTWYVVSNVVWAGDSAPDSRGSAMFKRIQVKDGQSVDVSMP
jgi:hypothetical protein